MKKIFAILIIIHFSLLIANAQWIQQNSGVNAQLYKVKFLNRYTGWTCGAGVILKTTDGGNNWINIPNPASNKSFYGLFILDSNTIYVTGYFETILKTTNSGQNWIEIKNGPWGQGNSYRSVYFINQNTGWIGSTGQKILKTTDGGQNFIEYSGTPYDIYDLYFKDSLNGILINFGLGPYKTTNGGINWYYATINLGTIYPWFYNLSVINNQYCYLPGSDGRIFKSSDFGNTWDSIAKTSMTLGTCSITFANLLTGWVGGNDHYIFKTTNGGINWIQESPTSFAWFSIYCYNELIVWGVGNPNIIMHTTTGGLPFSQIINNNEQITKEYKLFQNYPNPYNQCTIINVQLSITRHVKIDIYDITGKLIITIINQKQNSGLHNYKFDGKNLSSGIYFYSLSVNGILKDTKKMLIVK
jgi:photosystem II stability/assembly factor-like uncharacterized protein